ncbi:hypothetical protein [Kitasatospora sp. NPDC101183]|uniref:hypothetical protein n=1 Tax=Kitasatospora sp. NPDC101183 TaxID=3364100 RepID=UPI0038035B00
MQRWMWGVVGGIGGFAAWWAVLEAAGLGQDGWWVIVGRVLCVTAGVAVANLLVARRS